MRAIVDGLQLAWTLGIRRIQVHSDSMAAISILAKDSELGHQHAALCFSPSPSYFCKLFFSFSFDLVNRN
ncbi:hypothetical protein LINGRAHAP2_LOCUS19536 [Linum grandiflorum]